jgi:cell division septation protein DedD
VITNAKAKSTRAKKVPLTSRRGWWITMIAVAATWMFFLGIMVGRGTVPSQFDMAALEQELAELRKAMMEKTQQAQESETFSEQPEFFEKLKNPALTPADDRPATTPSQLPDVTAVFKSTPPLPPPATEPETEKAESAAPPHIEHKATYTSQKLAAEESKPPAPVDDRRYHIQAAAYENLEEAKQLANRLRGLGFSAYVASVKVSGQGIRHRIRIGPIKGEAEAHNTLTKLVEKANINGSLLR